MSIEPNAMAAIHARVKAITGHPLANRMRGLAEHLAFETELTVDVAIGCMKAFAEDLADGAGQGSGQSYYDRRSAAGSLGTERPATGNAASGWKGAADKANARFGENGVH